MSQYPVETEVTMDDDPEFEAMMHAAMAEPEVAVPVGLESRMMAWTAQEMAGLRQAAARPAAVAKTAVVKAAAASRAATPSFSHFGVLKDGQQSRGSFFWSVAMNLAVAALVVVVGSAVKVKPVVRYDHATLIAPETVPPKPPPAPPVKMVVPKTEIRPVEPPKVELPKVDLPPEIKPVTAVQPKVNLAPPAPKAVTAPPAPKVVSLAASAAAVPNADPHPSAVKLGRSDSPVKSTAGPAVSAVNLAAGMPGMAAGNSGNGPASKTVKLGSGAANGTNLAGRDNAPVAVKGLAPGTAGGTGTAGHGPVVVAIAPVAQAMKPAVSAAVVPSLGRPPVVTLVPKPVYTEEAKALHLQGDVTVNVRFLANGTMEVLSVAKGLGHGLDAAALEAARGIRFQPALDAAGKPTDFATTVKVHFLLN